MELSPVEFDDLINMVCKSVIARYDGDLEYWEGMYGSGDVGDGYIPLDKGYVRELIDGLWDDHVAVAIRDEAFERLTKYGVEHWPHGRVVVSCTDCGRELNEDEIATARDECFACYCEHQA